MTMRVVPAADSAGIAQGGATMKRPASTAVSDCCDRAAQSSSGTSTGDSRSEGQLEASERAAPSRAVGVAKNTRQ